MENPIDAQRVYRRVRVPRKKTRAERIQKYLEMPHLRRSDRNQRLALAGVILLLAVYLVVVRPLLNLILPASTPSQTQAGPAPKPGRVNGPKIK